MKKSDLELGMDRDITRRDFIHDLGLASLGMGLPGTLWAGTGTSSGAGSAGSGGYYPPTRTGMRGSHPGSFEVAHALAKQRKHWHEAMDTNEDYDLVVVGGGISGLAAAWFYRREHGPDSRILIIENHDDFGGHAKRNEFHQGGRMRLSWGGAMNLEHGAFSTTVNGLLEELGVNIDVLKKGLDFSYGYGGKGGPSVYFDAETYGRDVLVPGFSFRFGAEEEADAAIDRFPISKAARQALKQFYSRRENVFEGKTESHVQKVLEGISYTDFLQEYGALPEEATDLYVKTTHGYWGVGADSLSAAECMDAGLPMQHLLGSSKLHESDAEHVGSNVVMFPDGNASIARLLVKSLIPHVSGDCSAEEIALSRFDYSRLDEPGNTVRLRLESTAVNVENGATGATVTYVNDGSAYRVKSNHAVLACYHMAIPYLCPAMPEAQKEAQRYQVKRPLILTNVLLSDSKACDRLGISGAYCPGRLHGAIWQVKGVNTGGYRHEWNDEGPVPLMFWGSVAPPQRGMHIKDQHRVSVNRLMSLSFEDFEREVRSVLDGMLGPAGFDVQEDILAITVNRWPHGYAYDYLDLWDPAWPPGQAPHEIARKRFGNIAIANSDAGADAYTHVAIDQAWRAVNDLKA